MCQKTSNAKHLKKSALSLTVNSVEKSIPDLVATDFDSITFTPTTMAKFESAFSEFNDQLAAEAAGMGISWSDGSYMDGAYDTDSCEYDASRAKIAKIEHSYNQVPTSTTQSAAPQKPPRKLPGPRPRRPIEEMTPIEAERRHRRRERNKNAATKCRHRRVEITNELLLATTELEKEMSQLEQEIENLRRQKSQLEFVLESHTAVCQGNLSTSNTKLERSDLNIPSLQMPQPSVAVRPNSLPVTSVPISRTTLLPVNAVPVSSSMMSYEPAIVDFTPVDILSPSAYIPLSPSTLLAQ